MNKKILLALLAVAVIATVYVETKHSQNPAGRTPVQTQQDPCPPNGGGGDGKNE